MFTARGGVAAYHIVWIGFYLRSVSRVRVLASAVAHRSTLGVPVGPHVFYMFYMNILYVIGCKNIHTVLLKLYNQFYMNILYEIVCKNVHNFMKKNIWTPRVFLIFLRFLKEYFISLIA